RSADVVGGGACARGRVELEAEGRGDGARHVVERTRLAQRAEEHAASCVAALSRLRRVSEPEPRLAYACDSDERDEPRASLEELLDRGEVFATTHEARSLDGQVAHTSRC